MARSRARGWHGASWGSALYVLSGIFYAVQVGGVGPSGGAVQVSFELKKPPTVGGQAFLFWKTGPLRVSNMYVKSVPKNEKITLSCTKHACRKRTIRLSHSVSVPTSVPSRSTQSGRASALASLRGQRKAAATGGVVIAGRV